MAPLAWRLNTGTVAKKKEKETRESLDYHALLCVAGFLLTPPLPHTPHQRLLSPVVCWCPAQLMNLSSRGRPKKKNGKAYTIHRERVGESGRDRRQNTRQERKLVAGEKKIEPSFRCMRVSLSLFFVVV